MCVTNRAKQLKTCRITQCPTLYCWIDGSMWYRRDDIRSRSVTAIFGSHYNQLLNDFCVK